MTEPIMCSLTPEAIRAGQAGLLPGLAARATARESMSDGYRLTFNASTDTLHHIAQVVDAERQCCRWLRFDLAVPPSGEAITLTLTKPTGAHEFLAALFDSSRAVKLERLTRSAHDTGTVLWEPGTPAASRSPSSSPRRRRR